ncbi:MAG: TetR/AcrR family transcriptional regulator C-terminal domain-containing protein [Firmicutes bacterium]|nr:TetR/AcrR family transcriptional regulator C-terminal domain-containing protein [Bacillota bacterium]
MREGMRRNAKSVFADSLKELAKTKPLDKITVRDIVDNCGAGRQTFYNHFKDKYDLINWIYKTNAHTIWKTYIYTETWDKVIGRMLAHMKENQAFYFRAINDKGQNSFFDFLYEHTRVSYIKMIKKFFGEDALTNSLLFTIDLYCHGVLNMVKEWVGKGMKESPELIAKNIYHNMPPDLKKFTNWKMSTIMPLIDKTES